MTDLNRARTILGVSEDATRSEVKKAFRRAARSCHPDVSRDPGAAARFRALNAAYREALKHAKKDRPVLSAEESAYKAADEFYVTIGPRAHRVDLYM